MLDFLPNSSCSTSGLESGEKSALTAYRSTWLCLSMMAFKSSGLWFFSTPNVSAMKAGSSPFFLAISSTFLRSFSLMLRSSTFLKLLRMCVGSSSSSLPFLHLLNRGQVWKLDLMLLIHVFHVHSSPPLPFFQQLPLSSLSLLLFQP